MVLKDLGQLEEAKILAKQAYQTFLEKSGPGHHLTKRIKENLDSIVKAEKIEPEKLRSEEAEKKKKEKKKRKEKRREEPPGLKLNPNRKIRNSKRPNAGARAARRPQRIPMILCKLNTSQLMFFWPVTFS